MNAYSTRNGKDLLEELIRTVSMYVYVIILLRRNNVLHAFQFGSTV